MYCNEKQRFLRGRLSKTQYQLDDRHKKNSIISARTHSKFLQKQKRLHHINRRQAMQDIRHNNKLRSKTRRQWEYEHVSPPL